VSLTATHEKAAAELSRLKDSQNVLKKSREKAMKDLEAQMKAANKQSQSLRNEANKQKLARDAAAADVEAQTAELRSLQEQQEALEQTIKQMAATVQELSDKVRATSSKGLFVCWGCNGDRLLVAQVGVCRSTYEKAKQALDKKQAELSKCSTDIKQLENKREKANKAAHAAELEVRKCAHKLKQWEKDFKDANKQLQTLLKQHPWIEREKEYFGVSGSAFDFTAYFTNKSSSSAGKASKSSASRSSSSSGGSTDDHMVACSQKLKELKSEQEKLSKKINKKVVGMIEKAETEYSELARKREVRYRHRRRLFAYLWVLTILVASL
jgi:structural maintenance of chromosome 2